MRRVDRTRWWLLSSLEVAAFGPTKLASLVPRCYLRSSVLGMLWQALCFRLTVGVISFSECRSSVLVDWLWSNWSCSPVFHGELSFLVGGEMRLTLSLCLQGFLFAGC